MAASSFLLRSFRMPSTGRALCAPGSALYSYFLPHFRSHHLVCRSFSAQAVQASEPLSVSNETSSSRKPRNPGASWEEAGERYFSGKHGKNERDSDGGDKKSVLVRENVQSRSSRSNVEEEPAGNSMSSTFEGKKGRSTSTFDEGKLRNGQRGYGRGREEYNARGRGDDAGYPRRQFSDADSGRGGYRSRGFREEFSDAVDDRRTYRGNARNGADARGAYRSNGRSGGFREEFSDRRDDRMTYRSNSRSGGFREEFSNGVDGKSTYKSGGTLGKKQFPDADGGKRLFKGRFQGDGFVRKQMQHHADDDDEDKDIGRKGLHRATQGGKSGSQLGRRFQDVEEVYLSSEEEDEESEDFPEAGDVIRYSDTINAKSSYNKRQSHGAVTSGYDKALDEEEEEEEETDEEEDENAYRRTGFGAGRRELPAKGSSLPRLKGEVLYGVGPVYAALQISRREFFCLYVQANMPIGGGNTSKKKDKQAVEWIIRSAVDRGLEVKEVSKHDLNMLADNRPHQGLILDVSPLQLVVSGGLEAPCEENGKAPVWVALDEVTDPQNFGAILRSAYFLEAAGVVVCAKNSAPLSAVVSKASAGALEVMELRSCKNMMKFLTKSTENGWRVVGGSASGMDVTPVRELPRGMPTILVLGGEGKGLRTNVKRCCSELVCIPGLASTEGNQTRNVLIGAGEDFIAVESLNVSVAAGILLHELLNIQSAAECSTLTEAVVNDECVIHPDVKLNTGEENPSQEILNAQEESPSQERAFAGTG